MANLMGLMDLNGICHVKNRNMMKYGCMKTRDFSCWAAFWQASCWFQALFVSLLKISLGWSNIFQPLRLCGVEATKNYEFDWIWAINDGKILGKYEKNPGQTESCHPCYPCLEDCGTDLLIWLWVVMPHLARYGFWWSHGLDSGDIGENRWAAFLLAYCTGSKPLTFRISKGPSRGSDRDIWLKILHLFGVWNMCYFSIYWK